MKVSIVTINYNNAEGLKRTLESVDCQSFYHYEIIIVDGGSTDQSKAVIEEYALNHPDTKWVSEPDNGIYNAMNKGVKMASGKYCIFMNSGDCFFNNESLAQCFDYLDGVTGIVSGGMMNDDFSKNAPKEEELSLSYFIKNSMNHQSTFIKRDLLVKFPYNEKRKIVADSEFFFQTLILNNVSYKQIPICISYCEAAGESGNLQKSIEERMIAIKELIPLRMSYDADFIQKYHNPVIMGIGNLLYKRWLRFLFFKLNQLKKKMYR